MKKWLIILIAVILIVLISLSIFLINRFVSLASQDNTADSLPDEADILAYAQKHWPQYQAEFDAANRCLILSKTAALSYEDACKVGSSVYSGSTAPETYLDAVATITLALRMEFGNSVQAKLCFLSTDGEAIFTVTSSGEIVTCWE